MNQSLQWIHDCLQQLSSPDLHTIELTILADPMTDLRALDSECGTRPLDYVDFETRTIIRAGAGSMFAYQPSRMHGTTVGHRIRQHGTCSTSSRHIRDAQAASRDGLITREEHEIDYQSD